MLETQSGAFASPKTASRSGEVEAVVEYVYRCSEHGEVCRSQEPVLVPLCTFTADGGEPCGEQLASIRVQTNRDDGEAGLDPLASSPSA